MSCFRFLVLVIALIVMTIPICLQLELVVSTVALGSVAEPVAAKADKAASNPATSANNELAFDLYRQLPAQAGGQPLFFSPYSISTALVIVAEGARGETAGEMGKVLRFPAELRRSGGEARERPWDLGPMHAGLAALNKQFEAANRPASQTDRERITLLRQELAAANKAVADSKDSTAALKKARQIADQITRLQEQMDRYELRVANSLWAEKSYPFSRSYLDTISKYHGTNGAIPADFRNTPEVERQRINVWVEKQTRERIKDLIPQRAIDELTRLVVANAIYFKGQWQQPFEKAQTKDRSFTLADGKKVEAPTMYGSLGKARYAAFEKDGTFFATPSRYESGTKDFSKFYPGPGGFELLELPYKGGELSMLLFAPRSPDGLPALERMLTASNLQAWAGKFQQRPVNVYLPKFKMEASFDLGKTLQGLGMKRAFTPPSHPAGAQFDGMSEASSEKPQLYITRVQHKAFVEVTEQGTEAAAATAVIIGTVSLPTTLPFTPTFKADRPFVFLIRDQKSGTILFLGRVLNPKTGA